MTYCRFISGRNLRARQCGRTSFEEHEQRSTIKTVLHHRRLFYTIVGDAHLVPRCPSLRFDHDSTALMHFLPVSRFAQSTIDSSSGGECRNNGWIDSEIRMLSESRRLRRSTYLPTWTLCACWCDGLLSICWTLHVRQPRMRHCVARVDLLGERGWNM